VFSAVDIVNRALEPERWARERLAAHAGRAVRVRIGPGSQAFAIDPDGRLREGEAASPDLTLTIAAWRLPTLLAQPERWGELVLAQGDSALAATLSQLALTLPWFVEAVLAKGFGPVLGQRIADWGRRLLALPDYGAQRFAESFRRYFGEEARLVVGAAEARVAGREIDGLAARVDALASRIEALHDARRLATGPAP